MLHFLTGFYYFTWFENLLIIIAGLSLGHFLSLIVRQVQLIRHHRPLKRTLIEMAPWFVILLVLMLSPVFASGIAVGWMVIIGLLECVVEYLITLKLKQSRPAKSHVRQKTQHHKPAVEEFSDDDFDDADGDSANEINSYNHDTDRFDDADISSDRPVSHAVSHMTQTQTQTPQRDQSAAEPVSQTADSAAPAAKASSSQTSQAAQSAPESQAEQAPATSANTSSSAPTASHQPTSQEMMDHMFDFDPTVDYEAEAKSDTSATNNEQVSAQAQAASSAPAVSDQPSSQEAMDHVFDFDPNINYEAEAASAAKANEQSEAGNDENNN